MGTRRYSIRLIRSTTAPSRSCDCCWQRVPERTSGSPGITWGKGYEWETTFFDVTPISYAQMGLLPQVHRNEGEIYSNLKCLIGGLGGEGSAAGKRSQSISAAKVSGPCLSAG